MEIVRIQSDVFSGPYGHDLWVQDLDLVLVGPDEQWPDNTELEMIDTAHGGFPHGGSPKSDLPRTRGGEKPVEKEVHEVWTADGEAQRVGVARRARI